MKIPCEQQIRFAGGVAILAAAFLLLPLGAVPADPIGYASALAANGDSHDGGGGRDRGPSNNIGSGLFTENYTAAPCDTCVMGSGMIGYDNMEAHSLLNTPPCDTCKKGS